MKYTYIIFSLCIISLLYIFAISNTGCAQIAMPTGGPRDSIAPKLISASPKLNSTNVTPNKIILTFNEYVDLKEAQTNLLISPFSKKSPAVDFKLKTITVTLIDSLLPNTTYSINFGNTIVDNNEGNPLKDFTYIFSTGNKIDSLTLFGKVIIAETGKADSTLIAMLYHITDDSAVQKYKPDYIAKLHGDGSFSFVNLPMGKFKLYALKDNDGGKTYNSKKELFAFADSVIMISEKTESLVLYASATEKEKGITPVVKSIIKPKKLIYTLPAGLQKHDLLSPFELHFNNPLKIFDSDKLILRDTNYKQISSTVWTIDSSRTKIKLTTKWQEATNYQLIIDNTALLDSADNKLAKLDTIRFATKQQSDYGNVVLRFSNIDLTKHPILQLVQSEEVKKAYPLTAMDWSNKFINPGEYDIRILFDINNNGVWDQGDYSKKLQPEKVIPISKKLSVRADWDNELDIKL